MRKVSEGDTIGKSQTPCETGNKYDVLADGTGWLMAGDGKNGTGSGRHYF